MAQRVVQLLMLRQGVLVVRLPIPVIPAQLARTVQVGAAVVVQPYPRPEVRALPAALASSGIRPTARVAAVVEVVGVAAWV